MFFLFVLVCLCFFFCLFLPSWLADTGVSKTHAGSLWGKNYAQNKSKKLFSFSTELIFSGKAMVGKTSGTSVWIEAVSPNFPVAFEFAAMPSQQQQEQKIHNGMSLCTRRMAKTKKSDTTQVWRRCGEIGSFLCCWWECEMVPLLWRTLWLFLKKK